MKKIMLLFIFGMFLISLVSAEHILPTDLVDDDTGLLEGMGNWANNVTFGAFWFFLLAGFCFVLFMATVKYGTDRAFGYAGTTALLGSISLLIIGWISHDFYKFNLNTNQSKYEKHR